MSVGDHHVDMSIKRGFGQGGLPPAGHHRRCQAWERGNAKQCQQWALKGSHYCKRCGGNKRFSPRHTMGQGFYRSKVGATLGAMLDELAAAPPDERRSLVLELDLARSVASQAAQLFDTVFFTEAGKANASEQLKMTVMGQVHRSLEQVSKVAVALAKAEALAPDKLSAMQVNFYANAVTKILARAFEGDPRLVIALDEIATIKVPKDDQPQAVIVID